MEIDLLDRAIVARIPVLIKARRPESNGRRIVEVQASTEEVDLDGDIVMQDALMNSANNFVARGHLDIDHYSEFGDRLGISNPASYIIGKPISVYKGTGAQSKSTFVEGEISRSVDGTFDPAARRYDEFWESLQRDPPVTWYSSIFGYPLDFDDCAKGACAHEGATRWVIKSIDWRSLAFTRSPKNTALSSPTRIVTAKSYLGELVAKARTDRLPPTAMLPDTIEDAAAPCPNCEVHKAPSLLGYRRHFMACKGLSAGPSDILAHALQYRQMMQRSLPVTADPSMLVVPG